MYREQTKLSITDCITQQAQQEKKAKYVFAKKEQINPHYSSVKLRCSIAIYDSVDATLYSPMLVSMNPILRRPMKDTFFFK